VSPYGVHDMAGNVMEWTATSRGEEEGLPLIILRGGAWSSDGVDSSTFSRTITQSYIRSAGVGFRCAR
ncbi:MAG: SUMF1/EgtB/PvdO family nonheme iron enzyme, partial [Nitrospinae bacterium]|nr:SUMF1/EgtB/PvdO family nonheme iron enzyme [Nitrospinota bacterium]